MSVTRFTVIISRFNIIQLNGMAIANIFGVYYCYQTIV